MVAPCMAAMLPFLSLTQRVEVMRVAPAWRQAVKQRHLWATTEMWCAPAGAGEWLPGLIGGLHWPVDRAMELDSLPDDARVTALTLSRKSASAVPDMPVKTLRRALRRLRLRALTIHDSPPQQFLDALFGSPDEDLASVVPGDPSTHPAVWSWAESLEVLDLQMMSKQTARAFCVSMAKKVWPALRELRFNTSNTEMVKNSSSTRLLMPDVLPALRKLSIFLDSSVVSSEQLQMLTAVVQRFDALEYIDPTVISVGSEWVERALHLPLTVTKLAIMHLDHYARIASLKQLRELTLTSCDWTAYQVFEAIRHDNLPHLEMLSFGFDLVSMLEPRALDTDPAVVRLRENIRGMTTLRVLRAKVHTLEEVAPLLSCVWLEHIDLFPALTTLALAAEWRSAWHLPQHVCEVIARCRITRLVSMRARADMLQAIGAAWASLVSSTKDGVPLRELDLRMDSVSDDGLMPFVKQLRALPHLESISVQRSCSSESRRAAGGALPYLDDDYPQRVSYLDGLSELPHLRTLDIRDEWHWLTNGLLRDWCAEGRFPRLGRLHFEQTQDDEAPTHQLTVPGGLSKLLALPRLHHLSLPDLTQDQRDRLRRNIRAANNTRVPPLELVVDAPATWHLWPIRPATIVLDPKEWY